MALYNLAASEREYLDADRASLFAGQVVAILARRTSQASSSRLDTVALAFLDGSGHQGATCLDQAAVGAGLSEA